MAGLNLKVQLKRNQIYTGSTRAKVLIARDIISLYKSQQITPTQEITDDPSFLCFALNESDIKELTEISDKHKISMAELLRQGLVHLKLIVQK